MSKLLGIINPNSDPSDYFNYWLWRATEIPWEYEQLTIERMPVEGGNEQFRIIGPHTERYPDGVFLKWQVNALLNAQIKVAGEPAGEWIEPPMNTLLSPPNPFSAEPAIPTEPFSGQPKPIIPAESMVQPQPSQKEQLVSQIAAMLETLKSMS